MNFKTGKNEKPAKDTPLKTKKPFRRRISKNDRKGRKDMRRLISIMAVLMGVILLGAGAAVAFLFLSRKEEPEQNMQQAPDISEKIEIPAQEEEIGSDVTKHIVTAGGAVWNSFKKRPATVELPENAEDFADITECIIDENKRISVTLEGDGIPKSDDKYYYLFAMNTYDTGILEGADYLDRDYKNSSINLKTSLNYNLAGSRLFKKFVIAVKKDGQYVPVSTPSYITNPEAIARFGSVYQQPVSKKGLLVDPNKLRGGELEDLGVKQAAYNIPVARLLGPTSSAAYPTIYYTYNGKT